MVGDRIGGYSVVSGASKEGNIERVGRLLMMD